ncbi:DUF6090 family protein [Algoriphagus hitonicola]|uniref:Uncharacterized protein n=1 Tax=Algoriphagus hitonicola TaxID=435880 RepID=A0A1I2Q1U6_9BACT|nr:DUF6090 family protein [Algoriphagus hitonicola]SFG22324.1 hypothetical protein SAMN04487988_10276 [Algoriphagus hitonicola]
MISLFRKIRQKLLQQNRINRYLAYAIGEIFLVVIGILLALQINTWNQSQQQAKLERRILIEIDNNLGEDLLDVQDEIESFETTIRLDSILIQHFKSRQPFSDSIGAFLHVVEMSPHLSPGQNGYKLLESKGIDVISLDSLRMQISNLYERNYPYYMTYARERFQIIELEIKPFWTRNFFIEKHGQWPFRKRVPIDYHQLLDDRHFIPLIQVSSFQASVMLTRSINLKEEIEAVRVSIHEFLEKDKK